MSHSQFHSTNLFILRHAWLNLWDKHMTTGRINQVTTFPLLHQILRSWTLSWWEFVILWFKHIFNSSREPVHTQVCYWSFLNHKLKLPCSPISHQFRPSSFLFFVTTRMISLQRRTTSDQLSQSHGGFPTALIATSLAHQQVVHILHSLQAQE